MNNFKVLVEQHSYEEIIKSSRFIAHAKTVTNTKDAMDFIQSIEAEHPKARHHCWALLVEDSARNSDAGEPTGTAGLPIARAIESKSVKNIVLVVTRYFGGVKLGAGGLIRAYGGVANRCLDQAKLETFIPLIKARVICPIEMYDAFKSRISMVDGEVETQDWQVDTVEVTFKIPAKYSEDISDWLRNTSKGQLDGFNTV